MEGKGTNFLPAYIQLLIKNSGGIGFENLRRTKDEDNKSEDNN